MNFQTLHQQRKFVLLAAIVGVIAVFLPWIKVDLFIMSQTVNGFHGWGILVFICFALSLVLSLVGTQSEPLAKANWLITLIAGALSLLIIIILIIQAADASKSVDNAMEGVGNLFGDEGRKTAKSMFGGGLKFGVWIALIASIGIVASAWLFKSKDTTLSSAVQGISIPNINMPNVSTGSGNSNKKYAELEKLLDLKNKGAITEEEYQEMKKKAMGQ